MHRTQYYGVIGNRDHIKLNGHRLNYWEFLDAMPDGWLTSLTYGTKMWPPDTKWTIIDCGAWSYKHKDIPPYDALTIIDKYVSIAPPGAFLIAPDHMLIEKVDVDARREWNKRQAEAFLTVCPQEYIPMACIHGEHLEDRIEYARYLMNLGYQHLAIGGLAAIASRKAMVITTVRAIRQVTGNRWLHVLGLSSPAYMREWRTIEVNSCDGSSHFKQAFTGGTFFIQDGMKLIKHQAVRPGESTDHLPECDCRACTLLKEDGIDVRSYGSNQHNMGRAVHNQNMLMRAQRDAMTLRIGLVACSSQKLPGKHPAKDIYTSSLFKKARVYVERTCDCWFILSAKHGLLHPDQEIEYYDMTLNTMKSSDRREWSKSVAMSLTEYSYDNLIVLAGDTYCDWTESYNVSRPLKGLGIGEQLQWLTKKLKEGGNESNEGLLF